MQTTQSSPKAGNLDDMDYQRFLGAFRTAAMEHQGPLFTTDATGLWDLYLSAFEGDAKQHHVCHACRRFIEGYGSLVTIGIDGKQTPFLWSVKDDFTFPDLSLAVAFEKMDRAVRKAKVTGVFYSDKTVFGEPITGVWRHMSAVNTSVFRRAGQTPFQAMAEKKQDFAQVSRALADFSLEVLEQAVTLLSSQIAYRGDRVLGPAEWLRDLAKIHVTPVKKNLIWRAVALAPAGFCHPRSSVIGSLIEDLVSGMPADSVLARFNDKMQPSSYQRATTAPNAGAIVQAERLFAELGLAPALVRRYATLADLPIPAYLWTPPNAPQGKPAGLFGHLASPAPGTPAPLTLPTSTMTWAKFSRDVLVQAQTVEARVPATAERFMALVTAADPAAPPILQWDHEDERNPVSWYYASGVDAEMRRRVESAGGQYTNVDVRASLLWNNYNDLDLHVIGPDGYVWYGSKRPVGCRGWLDVDANAGGANTRTPVENIRWEKGLAPGGTYRVFVRHYATHDRVTATPFIVELEVAGEVLRFEGMTKRANMHGDIDIAEFVYFPGRPLQRKTGAPIATTPNNWNLAAGAFVPVRAFVKSPNLWNKPQPQHGSHVFALLEGCKDLQKGVGRGFFTEQVRSELRAVRSVLEAYAANAEIATVDAPACGLGFSDQAPWDLVLRVKSPGGVAHYTIDRWD